MLDRTGSWDPTQAQTPAKSLNTISQEADQCKVFLILVVILYQLWAAFMSFSNKLHFLLGQMQLHLDFFSFLL